MKTRHLEKGFNIVTTKGQYLMLYNIIAEHNSKVLDADPNFDMQTFDNLFQAITMATETYL
tara:strand:- start:70 stop:252 length:183 start_codon:yes stop_codon:yes gene_type:complete